MVEDKIRGHCPLIFLFFCQIIDKISSFVRNNYHIINHVKNQYLKIENIRSIITVSLSWNVLVRGGDCMEEKQWYKEKIIELITKCDDLHWLKTIYAYVNRLLR